MGLGAAGNAFVKLSGYLVRSSGGISQMGKLEWSVEWLGHKSLLVRTVCVVEKPQCAHLLLQDDNMYWASI